MLSVCSPSEASLAKTIVSSTLHSLIDCVAVMPKFTADMLEAKYGPELGRPPLSDAQTPRVLRNALMQRNPPDGIFVAQLLVHTSPTGRGGDTQAELQRSAEVVYD